MITPCWRAGASQPSRSTGTIFRYIYAGRPGALHTPTAMFYVVLNIRHRRKMRMRILSPLWSEMRMRILSVGPVLYNALWIQFLLATSMDSDCPTPNVQPTLDDGATPSAEACDQTAATAPSRASESTEARDRKLARDRARRREHLASETAEEKERRLSQRRVRDRARRAASRPSAHSEKARDRARRRERLASETAEEKERRYTCRTHSFTPSRWAAISPTSKRCGPGPSVVFY